MTSGRQRISTWTERKRLKNKKVPENGREDNQRHPSLPPSFYLFSFLSLMTKQWWKLLEFMFGSGWLNRTKNQDKSLDSSFGCGWIVPMQNDCLVRIFGCMGTKMSPVWLSWSLWWKQVKGRCFLSEVGEADMTNQSDLSHQNPVNQLKLF